MSTGTILSINNNSLLAGKTGHLLYLLSENKYDTEIFRLIEDIVSTMPDRIDPSFGTGITGIASVFNLLVEKKIIDKEEFHDIYNSIHQYLDKACEGYIQQGVTEFLFGASGIINYFINNKNIPSEILNKRIHQLIQSSTINEKLGFEPNRYFPHVNFGLAHGIPGTGLVLLNALQDPRIKQKEMIVQTLDKIESYILTYLEEDSSIFFPIKVFKETNEIMRSDALSWSYGDLGVLFFLIKLSVHNNHSQNIEKYMSLLHYTIARLDIYKPSEDNLGIRHGMAGQIMLLNRFTKVIQSEDLNRIKHKQIDKFSDLVQNRKLEEQIFERDLGAKTLLNDLRNSDKLDISSLFLI